MPRGDKSAHTDKQKRPAADRSASAKKGAVTRKRRAASTHEKE